LRSRSAAGALSLYRALFQNELRELFASRPPWVILLVLAPLVGYSFIQAISLFSEASQSALGHPEVARGMTPLDGVFVPAFGGFYLAVTLLFPFVAIRALGEEKQSGALKLTLQLPTSVSVLVALKFLAVGCVWLLALIPAGFAVVAWVTMGGHVYWPELVTLLLGHAIYGVAVAAIAFFAASVSDSVATAAIVALALTIGFWVLDFAGTSTAGWLGRLSLLSITGTLKSSERGLLAFSQIAQTLVLALGMLGAAVAWLPSGTTRARKLITVGVIVFACAGAVAGAGEIRLYADMTEDRRNSFDSAQEAALRQIKEPLTMTLYLSPDDSRAREMESNVLAKLKRAVPHLDIRYGVVAKAGMFGPSNDDRYGLVIYEYDGKREESRSNSPREILPIINELAGLSVKAGDGSPFPGYPLVTQADSLGIWFYGLLPMLTLLAWWYTRGHPFDRGGIL
jgi:ABC-2 type transport system permease protein